MGVYPSCRFVLVFLCRGSCANNPQDYLETTQPDTMVVVSLVQAEPDRNALPAIGFKVCIGVLCACMDVRV